MNVRWRPTKCIYGGSHERAMDTNKAYYGVMNERVLVEYSCVQ
jgi:hypothetical protein